MHKLTDVSNRSARDKSPIIQINLTRQKENHPQKKTVLNLTKIMKTKTEIGNLWEPQDNTQKMTSRTQSYRGSRNGSMYTENLSNSPSPSKYDPNLVCSVHHNRQNLKKRRIRYVCCCKGCNQHLLCNECVIKRQNCNHQLLKLENLMQQPILIFLDNDEVVQQLILQSNQLYQKVKQQAEQQIQLLSQNMSEFRQRINNKINQIEKQFKDRIDTQLSMIRVSVDHLQEICTVYKDDFDQRFDTGNSIISFKCNSDDPSNCIKQIVTDLQKNLSTMPTLHDTNTQNIIDLVNYNKFIQ
ncbi:hypothetical protein pb186bvf_008178 [Paramecium bursaria]